jgi:phosphoglycerate dehydrogenase-like enzyme
MKPVRQGKPFRVLMTHDLYDAHREILLAQQDSATEWLRVDFDNKPDNFLELLADVDCIVSRSDLSDVELSAARNLKLFQLPIAGYDQIDLARFARLGIPVANNAGANAISVAEHFFLMVLTHYRSLFHHHATVLDGSWVNLKHENRELFGKSVGIVGLGCVGREVAKRCLAFGMSVAYYDIRHGMDGFEELPGVVYRDLGSLVEEADILTFHIPLTSITKGMINDELLAHMRKHALLVNLSRGDIQDEAAIDRALRSGTIAGVALDVFSEEPVCPDAPLLQHVRAAQETRQINGKIQTAGVVRAVFTPHCGPSAETRQRVLELVMDNVRRVRLGLPPRAKVIDYEKLTTR